MYRHTRQAKRGMQTRTETQALGCYIDSDEPEEIKSNLESDDPEVKWRGRKPVDLLRSCSYLGKQCRILLKDLDYVEDFSGIVNTKKNPYHTKNMHFLEIAPDDSTGYIYMFGMTIDWYTLNRRLKNEEWGRLLNDLCGPDLAQRPFEIIEPFLEPILRFHAYWENALKLSVRKRAETLMEEHEKTLSVEGMLKELRNIEKLKL